MKDEAVGVADEQDEYYSIPEEAFELLPEEWRREVQAWADDGRAILKSVDKELSALSRVSNSMVPLVTLKHVRDRLASYKFAATMEAILELDMLVTAFVVTYVRLQEGGAGSGFSRDALPQKLRPFHDQIIDLRNKRFAHNAGHHSVLDAMEIQRHDGGFEIHLSMNLQIQVGGAPEWQELVDFIDAMYVDRSDRLVARLKERTGHEWSIPKGPAPVESIS
jgi:hypothetical protein